jgi:hypothetical protein
MDEEALLYQIVFTVQETQRALQNLLHNHKPTNGSDSQGIVGLDIAVQALGAIVGILERIQSSGGQLNFVHWILRAPVVPSISGYNISIAEALIWDMRNLEQRLIDINRQAIADGMISSLNGEVMNIRRMVDKYRSIIDSISSGQMM